MLLQDVAMAGLLSLGLWGQWSSVLDRRTVYPLVSSITKGFSAAGLAALQLSIGLWVTAIVSAVHAAAFVLLAVLRRPQIAKLEEAIAEQARRDARYVHWRCGEHVPCWRGPINPEDIPADRARICGDTPTCTLVTSDKVQWIFPAGGSA